MLLVPPMMGFMSPEGNGWGEGTSFLLSKGMFCMMTNFPFVSIASEISKDLDTRMSLGYPFFGRTISMLYLYLGFCIYPNVQFRTHIN
jgi:hypothetical protein